MSWLNHFRARRWPIAWTITAILSAYLAITGISSMIGGHLLPISDQVSAEQKQPEPMPTPMEIFRSEWTSILAPETQTPKPTVRPEMGRYLKEAQLLASKKMFREAMNMVNAAIAVPNKTPYEEFITKEMLAYVAINLRDYATAAQAYEETLDSAFHAADQYNERLKTLIQLYYQQKNYAQVKNFGQLYLDKNGYKAEILVLMAQADYIQKNYASAATLISTLIEKSNGDIKEDWLRMLMSCHHNMGHREEVVSTLTQLLVLYPTPGYWADMISYLNTAPKLKDRVSLEIFRLQQETIGLKALDRIEMAELSLALGLPGEAETVLQQGFKAKQFDSENSDQRIIRMLELAQKDSAADRAQLASLDKDARNTDTGAESIKLGEVYLSYEKYDLAVEALKRGLNKGNFAQAGEAQLHLGIALVNLKKKEDAHAAFNAVPKNSALNKVARLWLVYLKNM